MVYDRHPVPPFFVCSSSRFRKCRILSTLFKNEHNILIMLDEFTFEQALEEWNYWQNTPPPSVPRTILKSGLNLSPDLILVIQGVRRCGKSTLLAQIMQKLALDPRDCFFVNFEDPRLSNDLDHGLLDRILALAKKRRPGRKPRYFFFDEIQNVNGWEKWLRLRADKPSGDRYVVTGSNAALLSGDLASALTGRHITVELYPFDFNEYLSARPGATLADYLRDGGFPRTLSYPEPERLLREYCTDIVERDVRRHVAVRSGTILMRTVKSVFESMGSEVSQRSLAGMLGVTADTVAAYLNACQSAYLILECPYFTFSEKQRTARHKKYYPVDLGLRRSVAARTGDDRGKSLEAAVYQQLRRRHREVCYWRSRGEVDFVIQDQNGITPYQISWDGAKPRHERALEEFHANFPDANPAVFVTADSFADFARN